MKFRIQKIWVIDSRSYCAQVYNLEIDPEIPKNRNGSGSKHYLFVSAHPDDFKIELSPVKPLNCKSTGFAVEHLRRIISGGILDEIFCDSNNSFYLMQLYQSQTSEKLQLVMSSRDGGNFEILHQSGESLLRFGAKGVFTKRKETSLDINQLKQNLKIFHLHAAIQNQNNLDSASINCIDNQQTQSHEQISLLKKKLRRQIKILKRSLQEHEKKIPSSSEIDLMFKNANLLKKNSNLYRLGMNELKISSDLDGNLHIIPLNPAQSFGQNLDSYFHRLKKMQRAATLMRDHVHKINCSLEELINSLNFIETGTANTEFIDALIIKFTNTKQNISSRKPPLSEKKAKIESHQAYMTYLSETGVPIYVGKGAGDNDVLTKSARSEDTWLHAANLNGAHIIISFRDMKKLNDLQKKKLIEEAKILAAHFSKAKLSYGAEIYITQKQYLKKPSRSAPGLWQVSQARTEYVRYTDEVLLSILNRKLKK